MRDPQGDDPEQLLPLVYGRLRRLARAYLRRERRHHSLSPTDVVHEAYARLAVAKALTLAGKTHFYALAAREMRRVLREHAQKRDALKRGGDLTRVSLPDDLASPGEGTLELIILEEFLEATARRSPRRARVLEMRVFAGMTENEMAAALGVTPRTIRSDLAVARARLAQHVQRR